MAYREVSRVEMQEVVRRWQAGEGLRAIARSLGRSRATVQKYVRAAEALGLERTGPPPTEAQLLALVQQNLAGPRQVIAPGRDRLTPFTERIQQWVQGERLQLTRVQELLGQPA